MASIRVSLGIPMPLRARAEALVEDLVEPAKVTALEKLGDGRRALVDRDKVAAREGGVAGGLGVRDPDTMGGWCCRLLRSDRSCRATVDRLGGKLVSLVVGRTDDQGGSEPGGLSRMLRGFSMTAPVFQCSCHSSGST